MRRVINLLYILLLTLTLVWPGVTAEPYEQPRLPWTDEFLLSQVKAPVEAAAIDDYLIQLGEAAAMNIVADVTEIPPEARVAPYPGIPAARAGVAAGEKGWAPLRVNLLTDLTSQQELSLLRLQANTILLWKEPDVVDVGRLILAQSSWARARNIPDTLTKDETVSLLGSYLMREQGWDGRSTGAEIRVKFTNLPLELQQQARAEVARWSLAGIRPQWLDPAFWEHVTLAISYGRDDNNANVWRPWLTMRGTVQEQVQGRERKRIITLPVGRLDPAVPILSQQAPRKQVR